MTRPPGIRISAKAERFTESVIREMNRLAMVHGAVSLAQGFPDFPAPDELKQAAADALFGDINQYALTWGSKPLRDAIAAIVSSSSRVNTLPVGLWGEFRTMARVRIDRTLRSASGSNDQSGGRRAT